MSSGGGEDLYASKISGNYFECRPLFVEHRSLLLCAFGSHVQAVSTHTGALIGTFSGHAGLVSAIVSSNAVGEAVAQDTEGERVGPEDVILSASLDGALILWSLVSFLEIRRIELNAAIHDVLLPHSAGRFVRGLQSEGPAGEEIFLVVRGDAAKRTASAPSSSGATDSVVAPHARGQGASVERFKLVSFSCHSQSTTRKLGRLRHARQCAAGLQLQGLNCIVFGSKAKLTLWAVQARRGDVHVCSEGVITCVAGNGERGLVVTGHEGGEILLWHDLPRWVKACAEARLQQGTPAPPVTTKLHWHAHAVCALALSSGGDYLFSGGDEGTLVVWQVATGKTSFVPRLGAAITHIACAKQSARVCAAAMDNSLHVVDAARMREEWCLRSLCVSPRADRPTAHSSAVRDLFPSPASQFVQSCAAFRCTLRMEPRRGHLVCNGYPGLLQSLDLSTRAMRATHEVVAFTRVSKTEAHTRLYVPSVTHFEYLDGPLGLFLATVDVRRGAGNGPGLGQGSDSDASLKFFQWDAGKSEYRLTAQVDRPHGPFRITSVAFAPAGSGSAEGASVICATAAVDGTVKLWRAHAAAISALSAAASVAPAPHGGARQALPRTRALTWTCAASFQHKDCPCHALAYSRDGSLLAVAQENVVSLWDPSSLTLRGSLVAPTPNNVVFVAFLEPRDGPAALSGSGEAFLVLGTRRGLAVFDLLTLQLCWAREGRMSAFAVAPVGAAVKGRGAEQGWIAVCGDGAEEGETDEDEGAGEGPEGAQQQRSDGPPRVTLYSPRSARTVASHALSSRASSLCFCEGGGLLAVTEGGEVLYLAGEAPAPVPREAVLASIPAPALPAVPMEHEGSSPHVSFSSASASVASRPALSAGTSLLDPLTSALPPVSAIAQSFLQALLGGSRGGGSSRDVAPSPQVMAVGGDEEDDEGNAANRGSSSSSSSRGSGGKRSLDVAEGPRKRPALVVDTSARGYSASQQAGQAFSDEWLQSLETSLQATFAQPRSYTSSSLSSSSSSSTTSAKKGRRAPGEGARPAEKETSNRIESVAAAKTTASTDDSVTVRRSGRQKGAT